MKTLLGEWLLDMEHHDYADCQDTADGCDSQERAEINDQCSPEEVK